MNSDDLGEAGEKDFEAMFPRAGLVGNKASRDRTGWDYLVEYPFVAPTRGTSLDKQPAPISCYVQVKTMLDNNDSFSVTLSSARRLAKEPKPAFYYILKLDRESYERTSAYLIHVLDDPLEKILKRLRESHVEGGK